MLEEVLRELDPKPGQTVCDCTLGGAGHTIEIAKRISPNGLSIGIDQDDTALEAAARRFENELPDADRKLLKGNFSELDELLVEAQIPEVDGFLFDLGVSSPMFDSPSRGFSYNENAPLDMRMDPGKQTLNAAEVINTYNEADLARILSMYGDESFAPRIAREMVRRRQTHPIRTTFDLVDVVKAAIPASKRRHGGHPAKRTFQAIRIEVNHELDVLEKGLRAAIRWAGVGGVICVISYHSLEDRIVKHIFSEMSRGCTCPPDLPVCACGNVPIVQVRTKRPLVATSEEVAVNPRAHSAKMRVAVKLDDTAS